MSTYIYTTAEREAAAERTAEIGRAKADALREVADIWYSDDGPSDGSAVTWLYARAERIGPSDPDPEAVEQLAETVRQVKEALGPIDASNEEIARQFMRRGVYVEMPA